MLFMSNKRETELAKQLNKVIVEFKQSAETDNEKAELRDLASEIDSLIHFDVYNRFHA